jgi:hypothetical protein
MSGIAAHTPAQTQYRFGTESGRTGVPAASPATMWEKEDGIR